jgi:hypothetical protein
MKKLKLDQSIASESSDNNTETSQNKRTINEQDFEVNKRKK